MSKWASSCRLLEAILLSVNGSRPGSVPTSLHTSDKNWAVISLTSLCRLAINPPVWQLYACCTVNDELYAQHSGNLVSGRLYLKQIAFQNDILSNANPYFFIGKTSQPVIRSAFCGAINCSDL